jgi:hypothetical protein
MALTNFTRVLEEKKGEIGYHQVWRWVKDNRMPKLINWLADRPELAEALAEDARSLGRENGTVAQAGESSYTKSEAAHLS